MNCLLLWIPSPVTKWLGGPCPKCLLVDELIEELIRKQLRERFQSPGAYGS
jgi:hypothetical protein